MENKREYIYMYACMCVRIFLLCQENKKNDDGCPFPICLEIEASLS